MTRGLGRLSAADGPKSDGQISDVKGSMPERRILSIVFIDLVGSTAISNQLDVEELHELMRTYLGTVKEITNSFGGHVLKYLGDGVLSVFGWPLRA